jgi:hypothetical protein
MKWHTGGTFCRLIYMPVRYLATKQINSNDFPGNQWTQTMQLRNIRIIVYNVTWNGDPMCGVITYDTSPLLNFFFTHKSHFLAFYSAGTDVFSLITLRLTRVRVCKKLFVIGMEREFPWTCDVTLPYMAARHLLSWIAWRHTQPSLIKLAVSIFETHVLGIFLTMSYVMCDQHPNQTTDCH